MAAIAAMAEAHFVPNALHVSSSVPQMLQIPPMLQMQIARNVADRRQTLKRSGCRNIMSTKGTGEAAISGSFSRPCGRFVAEMAAIAAVAEARNVENVAKIANVTTAMA